MAGAPADGRHRDRNGEISRKHGATLIRTLRRAYGHDFAAQCPAEDKLSDCLWRMDDQSLSQLVRDHEAGTLGMKCKEQGTR